MSRSFSPVEKSAHIRILPFGFFTVTMGAAQADLSIGVSTPMPTYRCNSFPTASCIANANGKGFRNTGTTPFFSSTCIFEHLEIQRTRHFVYATQLHFLLICKERAKSFSCSECVDPILTHHIGRSVFGHSQQ
ncbi:hypothetical protein T01_4760 [Trichinella spiralis]|uniref:Uncharacterized protein n=1 Tax=Trichinella spiralis TaxID=6334 RepID=A0A0V1BUH2_TRISP|nr:hypothetical protein T01_4760 [Trichinella spiralis]